MRQGQGHVGQGQLWMGRGGVQLWMGRGGVQMWMGRGGVQTGGSHVGQERGRQRHVPLQGLSAILIGMAADFGEDALHVGLVGGRQHHGVTSALAAPSTGAPAARRRPYMRCWGTARPQPAPLPAPPALDPVQAGLPAASTPVSAMPRSSP